jgi:hypothetical protein
VPGTFAASRVQSGVWQGLERSTWAWPANKVPPTFLVPACLKMFEIEIVFTIILQIYHKVNWFFENIVRFVRESLDK